jgi:hypothetical protein
MGDQSRAEHCELVNVDLLDRSEVLRAVAGKP